MDSIEQASGEKRVREILVEGLLKRGLAKPSRLTKDQFEASVDDLCKRLAYMTTANLEALQEVAAARPGGKLRDQMPIANAILDMASDIQAPPEDASPLIRAVFASALGADALAGGWAPELLGELRRNRRWPNAWTVSQIKTDAEPNVRQLRSLEGRLARGDDLGPTEAMWRDRRVAALRRCQEIAELAERESSK
ncbi:hypothetical protein [uncultured Roseovarius sp.]|uniref:hypothetical protein n=1 Tax=uncultured Roseovarius sp. TaxID=293344 RepID=UPI000C4DB1A9|nr:hypothetical protein [Roseovarius sp.]MBD11585.1 hypothetical protein [Roseovarius sp.]|tara:strand:+ start:589 stop:1173 length:585 start_codon:yes stop_codon:yes gene_type:complete